MKKNARKYDYHPDRWVIVKLQPTDGSAHHYRVFGTWGGGYLHGQSWKLNSGIESAILEDDYFYFAGHSGSVYKCHKGSYGYFSYGMSVLSNMIEGSKDNVTISLMPEETNWLEVEYK